MEIVDLKSRNLSSIPESIFQDIGYGVRFLYLNNNNIRTLPDKLFTGLPNLTWLDLRCNRVRRIPDSVEGHPNLQVFLLGKNNLKELPTVLGSIRKLRELQFGGNPLEFPSRDVLRKGSKYLIKYLQRQWLCETDQSENDENLKRTKPAADSVSSMPVEKKLPDSTSSKRNRLMERYSWPMIFLTNWSSDRLVTDRDIRMKELERLYLEKQKAILEKQERNLQLYKNKETLRAWRNKAKQLQRIESTYKCNNYKGLEMPFGIDKDFFKMEISESLKPKRTTITMSKPFDFDLEMSNIYQMLIDISSKEPGEEHIDEKNESSQTTTNVEKEMQKLHAIQKRIINLKSHITKK
ncbi:leucine-rich repeat-containing protein 57-like isoform X2 [Adelges cooleyi]|uniref:leucine-rich repeat-containing protein 57-like isoform X2 n=1 Tax=Adelges cooleyi TaxID=133065 RepID=UPI00217FA6C3|nr:leucine-rich repeat-containing protein 57-like isoform X2 [Adelges cooleyi]